MSTILERIKKELLSWPYVTAEAHKFGGIEFRLNKREMGHIHGDRVADLPFPMDIRNKLVNSCLCLPIIFYHKQDGLAIG
jgi:Luciferase